MNLLRWPRKMCGDDADSVAVIAVLERGKG